MGKGNSYVRVWRGGNTLLVDYNDDDDGGRTNGKTLWRRKRRSTSREKRQLHEFFLDEWF
jgi:hypothetical protein